MADDDVQTALQTASELADTVSRSAPGPLGTVAKIAALAFRAGSRIASRGEDPVFEITRMLSARPQVEGVHSEWDEFIERNFPQSDPAPSSLEKRATDPSMPAFTDEEDPYEGA